MPKTVPPFLTKVLRLSLYLLCAAPSFASSPPFTGISSANEDIADQLGWVKDLTTFCKGYYLEPPFTYPEELIKKKSMVITSDQPFFSFHGTSTLPSVTINREGQQITAKQAYLYRDKTSGKISTIDLSGAIHLREPMTLIIADKAHLDLANKSETLNNILYRTVVYSNTSAKLSAPSNTVLQKPTEVRHLSAWGKASEVSQTQPKIYEFKHATFSTCPPLNQAWHLQAKDIVLNKITGRGTALDARLYIQKVPVFYTPYFNFPIDNRRKSGFLFPFIGKTNSSGTQITAPFYWNLAPNYDTTITPTIYSKRGFELDDKFRYLTSQSEGQSLISILPHDNAFVGFQRSAQRKYGSDLDPINLANLRHLESASATRGALSWQHERRFDSHWATHIDYNYVTDDYYLSDLRNNLNEVTQNQLLQLAYTTYKDQHWNFEARIQRYQTLHPVDVDSSNAFINQYTRLPQLSLGTTYPGFSHGFSFNQYAELTHFDIHKNPGVDLLQPIGNRAHLQPGLSRPFNLPYFYMTPRLQMALTKYQLHQLPPNIPSNSDRALPIFDISTGMYFDRDFHLFQHSLRQTLEPQLYYTYIPYRNQDRIPIFDTVTTTLTYDQLFTYNRFSGLDRIGDANQVSLGLSTTLIDNETGAEKARAGIGEIIYFKQRKVTLCTVNDTDCPDFVTYTNNKLRRSPLAAILSYHLNPNWTVTGNTIWNTQLNQMNNQNISIQYSPGPNKIINLAYNFVRNGDIQDNLPPNSKQNNLKQTDFSFSWPLFYQWSAVGRLTRSINEGHFQNMLSGLQYDSCCWAVRFIGGRTFVKLAPPNGSPTYRNEIYIQFSLKGLGNFGVADPSQLLSSSIPGYTSTFGQDF